MLKEAAQAAARGDAAIAGARALSAAASMLEDIAGDRAARVVKVHVERGEGFNVSVAKITRSTVQGR